MKIENFTTHEAVKSYVISLMPAPPIEYAVSEELQRKQMESLKESIGSRRFFFCLNLEKFEIEHVLGIQRWLGYPDKDFTIKKYHDIQHPGKRKISKLIALNFIETYSKGIHPLNFMAQRYSTLVALRHYRGHYVLTNKVTSVFQHDKQNRITGCIHEFTLIKDFDNEALTPTFFMSNGEEDERGKEIMEKTRQQFEKLKVFSPKELHVAKKMAHHPGMTRAEIAAALEISVDDLHQYYNRLLKKSRDFFEIDFPTTLEAVLYVKKTGLL